jgi:hypothetical protein
VKLIETEKGIWKEGKEKQDKTGYWGNLKFCLEQCIHRLGATEKCDNDI